MKTLAHYLLERVTSLRSFCAPFPSTFTGRCNASRTLPLLGALGVLAAQSVATASTTWTSPTWNVSTVIPDNDEVGLSDTHTVAIPQINQIENVAVTVLVTGGWNGDLYAYLVHDSGFAVLLNRPGRSLANPDGSATQSMAVRFEDSATLDIHTGLPMSGGLFSGAYQPDGRTTDPLLVLDTDPRTAMLASFTGLDPSGSWTLFVADQSAGFQSTLQSWSLEITGVPESGSAVIGMVSGIGLLIRRRR